MTQPKKTMLDSTTAHGLVHMWFEKGQITKDCCVALRHNLMNREFDETRITKWSCELEAWRATQRVA